MRYPPIWAAAARRQGALLWVQNRVFGAAVRRHGRHRHGRARGAIAEFEYALMSERILDGLAAARARGRTGGQKPKLTPRRARIAQAMYGETGPDGKRCYTVAQIAAEFGATCPTIYRLLRCLTPA
jgi:DNA invertase Pin-like site-specific DNA recombinase